MKNVLDEILQIRKRDVNIIAVSNSEWYSLFRDEIRNSIAIEGIFTNRNELLKVIHQNKRTIDQKSAAILGYFESASSVYEYANNLYKEGEFSVRISDIKQIHTILMRYEKQIGSYSGTLGNYRSENVEVLNSTFTPLSYIHIPETMEVFIKWLNKNLKKPQYDIIKLITLSHIIFETIHPFRDGNGRVGRIFLSFLLIGVGYLNIAIKGTTQRDRDNYYNAIEAGDDQFEIMLREIENGKKPTLEIIDNYANKTDSSLLEKIIRNRLSDSVERLKRGEFSKINLDAEITLREASKFYNYSQDYLRNLINNGKIKGKKKGKLWFVKILEIENYINKSNL